MPHPTLAIEGRLPHPSFAIEVVAMANTSIMVQLHWRETNEALLSHLDLPGVLHINRETLLWQLSGMSYLLKYPA